MYKRTVTLEQINKWEAEPDTAPSFMEDYLKKSKYWAFKRNPSSKPATSLDDIHPYALDMAFRIQEMVPHLDLYLTGSWVNGTYCHPDVTPEYSKLRAEIGKPEISDMDFYIHGVSAKDARIAMWEVADIIVEKVDAVVWWGSGISVKTGEFRACNPENKLGPQVRRQYFKYYEPKILEELFNELSR